MTPVSVRRSWLGYAAAFVGAIAVLALFFSRDMQLPGLYMDSINPEYLAVRSVSPEAMERLPAYALPGNLIDGKYPVLAGSYYHGPLQFYIALPVYAALGTDIFSARIMQGLYGALILLGMTLVFRRYPVRLPIAVAALALLALEPGFNIALKTQAYNVTWPLLWVFLAIAGVEKWASPGIRPRARQLLYSGFMLGLAFYCYFVYLFFLPALAWYLSGCLRRAGVRGIGDTLKAFVLTAVGFGAAGSLYLVGYALAANKLGGVSKFMALHGTKAQTLVAAGDLSPLERFLFAARAIGSALSDEWVSRMVLMSPGASWLGELKSLALVLAPLAMAVFLRVNKRSSRLLELGLWMGACFFAASFGFGQKISGHHYTLLLPLLYLAIAAGLSDAWPLVHEWAKPRAKAAIAVVCMIAAGFGADSVLAHAGFGERLRKTGGVRYFSDAINRYSEHALADPGKTAYYFPDWGLVMPFLFLTGGREDARHGRPDVRAIERATCRGRTVEVAYMDAKGAAAFLREMRGQSTLPVPHPEPVLQRDGVPAIYVVAFSADEAAGNPGCAVYQPTTPSVRIEDPAYRVKVAPGFISSCASQGMVTAQVDWDLSKSGARTIDIWVANEGQRTLWSVATPIGSGKTGPWTRAGVEFQFEDSATKRRLATAVVGGYSCR